MKYWNIYSDADKKDKYTYVAFVDSCNEYIFLTRLVSALSLILLPNIKYYLLGDSFICLWAVPVPVQSPECPLLRDTNLSVGLIFSLSSSQREYKWELILIKKTGPA